MKAQTSKPVETKLSKPRSTISKTALDSANNSKGHNHKTNTGVHDEEEDALKESEIRYRRLFESAKDGILILNATTGQITDVNPFLINLLGYSHEEMLGKKLWEIGLFKDAEVNREAFKELQEKKYIRYEELPLQTKKGVHVEVEFVSNVYQSNGKNDIVYWNC